MIFERPAAFDIIKAGRRESDIERNNSWLLFQVRPLLDMLLVYRHNRVLCNGHIVSSFFFFPNSPEALDCFLRVKISMAVS